MNSINPKTIRGKIYQKAFLTLQDRIKNGVKTTYGKNELTTLMAEIFVETVNNLDVGDEDETTRRIFPKEHH
jgi:hypothetical protein